MTSASASLPRAYASNQSIAQLNGPSISGQPELGDCSLIVVALPDEQVAGAAEFLCKGTGRRHGGLLIFEDVIMTIIAGRGTRVTPEIIRTG